MGAYKKAVSMSSWKRSRSWAAEMARKMRRLAHANGGREGLCVVNTLFLAGALGHESGLKAKDVSKVVSFDLVDPHAINDATTREEFDQRPCVIGL
jgi:hypothetical protein